MGETVLQYCDLNRLAQTVRQFADSVELNSILDCVVRDSVLSYFHTLDPNLFFLSIKGITEEARLKKEPKVE